MTPILPGDATAADYAALLLRLAPPGPVFGPEGRNASAMTAAGEELARFHNRVLDLLLESDPATAVDMLDDWADMLGVDLSAAASRAQAQAMVSAAYRATGGNAKNYFISLAAAAGLTITITEYLDPWTAMKWMTYPMYTTAWCYAWQVNGSVADPAPVRASLETLFQAIKPLHTTVVFSWT